MVGRTTLRRAAGAALTAMLVWTGAAQAEVPGGLVPVLGAAGCVINGGAAGACSNSRELGNVQAAITSPDGTSYYVAGTNNTLLTFDRNAVTGQLTQKAGRPAACTPRRAPATAVTLALNNPTGLAITPDGRSVYVVSSGTNTIFEFDRLADGSLNAKPGTGACISAAGGACAKGRGMVGPQRMAIDHLGQNLYVTYNGGATDGVSALRIDPGSGALGQLDNGPIFGAGCVQQTPDGTNTCDDGKGLDGAKAIAVSPTGTAIYVGSSTSLSVLTRDPATGLLGQATSSAGCIAPSDRGQLHRLRRTRRSGRTRHGRQR